MILIIGGAYQGKTAYAKELFPEIDWIDGRDCEENEVFRCEGIHHFHSFIERLMRKGEDVSLLAAELYASNPGVVIISDEIGYGIVPMDAFERGYREMTGRICTELAARSREVHRVICGIGTLIKKSRELHLYLIRHSITEGNRKKRYIGRTDQELCEEGIELLKGRQYPKVQRVYVSPMKRCLETAALIYPEHRPVTVPELTECDFGIFENKNYQELADISQYQEWVDSGGTLPFPGGESKEAFAVRSLRGFERSVRECLELGITEAAFVVHGGTIMTVMEQYACPSGEYYEFQAGNGEGYELIFTDDDADRMSGRLANTDGSTDSSGGSGISAGSAAGGSGVAVSSGTADRAFDCRRRKNYQKLSAKN